MTHDSRGVRHDNAGDRWGKVPARILELPLTRQQLRAFIALSNAATGKERRVPNNGRPLAAAQVIADDLNLSRRRARELLAALAEHKLAVNLGRHRRTEPDRWLIAPFPDDDAEGVPEPAFDQDGTEAEGVPEPAIPKAGFQPVRGRAQDTPTTSTEDRALQRAAGGPGGPPPAERIPRVGSIGQLPSRARRVELSGKLTPQQEAEIEVKLGRARKLSDQEQEQDGSKETNQAPPRSRCQEEGCTEAGIECEDGQPRCDPHAVNWAAEVLASELGAVVVEGG